MRRRRGVTRTVFVGRRWALKVPTVHYRRNFVRGWLANRSEWRQRKRRDVARPVATLFHFVLVMPAAKVTGADAAHIWPYEPWVDRAGDDAKPCSWGWFGDRWLLIDYDRAWEDSDRGIVGGIYYAIQERRAREWIHLPPACESCGDHTATVRAGGAMWCESCDAAARAFEADER